MVLIENSRTYKKRPWVGPGPNVIQWANHNNECREVPLINQIRLGLRWRDLKGQTFKMVDMFKEAVYWYTHTPTKKKKKERQGWLHIIIKHFSLAVYFSLILCKLRLSLSLFVQRWTCGVLNFVTTARLYFPWIISGSPPSFISFQTFLRLVFFFFFAFVQSCLGLFVVLILLYETEKCMLLIKCHRSHVIKLLW